jgi:hypothetical protein
MQLFMFLECPAINRNKTFVLGTPNLALCRTTSRKLMQIEIRQHWINTLIINTKIAYVVLFLISLVTLDILFNIAKAASWGICPSE